MANVRRYYGVPVRRGARVTFRGYKEPLSGSIISCTGSHIYLRLDDGRRFGPCHPTYQMDYGDGRDYSAEMDVRIAAFNRMLNRKPTQEPASSSPAV